MKFGNRKIRINEMFAYLIILSLLFTPISLAQEDNILNEKNLGSNTAELGLFGKILPVSNEDIFTKSEDLLLLASPDENVLILSQSIIEAGSAIQITIEPGIDPINEFIKIKDSTGKNVGVLIIPGCTDSACIKRETLIKFIISARKKGYKDNDLKILLIKAGWEKEMVERAFRIKNSIPYRKWI
ncbi:MAG: hypothetical protein V1740_02585 [Candidatus Woesearchaeota archaeon]